MKFDWYPGRSGNFYESAEDGNVMISAGKRDGNPGNFFYVVFINGTETQSGRAPTLNAAKNTAEYLARRLCALPPTFPGQGF